MQHLRIPELEKVSWDDIALMASIAEFGSLRQAALAFRVNASTLVRRVEKLEESLGTRILDRLPQGFRLNKAGAAIAAVAREMRRHFLKLQDVAKRDQDARGRVKIAITEGLGAFWLAPRLPSFTAEHPELLLELEMSMDLKNLMRHEADVAVQIRRPENPDLIAVRLCHLHIYPFASLAYIERYGLPSLVDRRPQHKLVLQESEQIASHVIDEFLRQHGIERDVAIVTNSSVTHLYAVEKGMGIGGLPTFAMAMGARLVPIDIGLSHTAEVWVSYRRELRRTKRIALVVDWLRRVFDPRRYPWFAPGFIHPAEIMAKVNQAMARRDYFDSTLVKTLRDDPMITDMTSFRNPSSPAHSRTS